jgi:hypothetical protein
MTWPPTPERMKVVPRDCWTEERFNAKEPPAGVGGRVVSLRGGANQQSAIIGGTCGVGESWQTDDVPWMLGLTGEAL